jgi:deoxycytidine triphosphate deaminase
MLTSAEITKFTESGKIVWPGDLRGDGLLLRLGAPAQLLVPAAVAGTVDLADQASIDRLYQPHREDWDSLAMAPGQMMLCQVQGSLQLSAGLAGAIGTLSHLARVGLATHVASPWVLPGWKGELTLELLNVGPATLSLHRGMPVARLLIFKMDGPVGPAVPHAFYGTRDQHLGSRYAAEFPIHEYKR